MFAAKSHTTAPSRPSSTHNRSKDTFIQPKLNIGKLGDKYEVEADRTADMVVAKSNDQTNAFFAPVPTVQKQNEEDVQTQQEDTLQEKPLAETITPVIQLVPEEEIQEKTEDNEVQETLQKKGDEDALQPKTDESVTAQKETKESVTPETKTPIQKSVDEDIQKKEEEDIQEKEEENLQHLQMQSSGGDENPSSGLESNLNSSKGGGNPLASDTRQEMESGFGADFNGVRVHNDSNAVQMNQQLGAQAFTSGNDIYFNEGKYSPHTNSGKHLLAHELTHTIQQGASSSQVQQKEIIIQRKTTSESADAVIDALEGYTSGWDSADILNEFNGKSTSGIKDLLEEIKSRASSQGVTRDGMVDWLFNDMTAEDGRALRKLLIKAKVSDVNRLVAISIYNLLSGFTSASNSGEILGLFSSFSGSQLDNVLYRLELYSDYNTDDLRDWLFSDLTSVDGEKLRVHFLTYGGVKAIQQYGAKYTAKKIYNLLSGYTSIADSWSILSNFDRTPQGALNIVLHELNNLTGTDWGERKGADALMQDMQYADYIKLQQMAGITLPIYDYEKSWLESAWDGFTTAIDWVAMIVQWGVCGLIGIVTGVLSVVWDIVVLVKDLAVAAYNIIGMIVYFVSGGAAMSAEWLAVKDFFKGLGKLFSAPGEVISKAIEEITMEGTLIEGPLEACFEAEFWVRKVVNAIVNIILIFAAGYGAVKGAASGIKTIAQVISKVGVTQGIRQLAAMVLKSGSTFIAGLGDDAIRVINALKNPAETMAQVSTKLSNIKLAANDVSYWEFLRQQAGSKIAAEREFWEQYRSSWAESALSQEARLAELEGKVGTVMNDIEGNNVPNGIDKTVDDIEKNAKKLADDADDLNTRVTQDGPEGQPVKDTDGPTTPKSEIESLTVDTHRLADGHEMRVLGDGRVFICSDPCLIVQNLGGRVDLFKEIVETGVQSRKFASSIEAMAARGNVPVDDFMNAVKRIQQSGGENATRLAGILDEIAAGGDSAAELAVFMEKVTRISAYPDIEIQLAELYRALKRGDAILDHGPLQTPEFFEKPHRFDEGLLWQDPSGMRPAKQVTKRWNSIVDFVIFDDGSGLKVVFGRNHSGLSGGRASVYGAGELHITKNGDVVKITNQSGHYVPTPENLDRAYQWLIDNKHLIDGIEKVTLGR